MHKPHINEASTEIILDERELPIYGENSLKWSQYQSSGFTVTVMIATKYLIISPLYAVACFVKQYEQKKKNQSSKAMIKNANRNNSVNTYSIFYIFHTCIRES